MSESRVVKTQRNVVMSILQKVVFILITFISRIIFVRILDESYLGINGLFSNILSILSVADLGMGTAMMYSLYKPIAEHDIKKISSLISFFKKIYLGIATAILIIGLALVPFLKYIVNLDQPIPFLEGYYVLALLNIVISYLFVYRTTLVAADQKNYILNKYIIVFQVISCTVQILVLILCKNYFIYLLVAVIISFISNMYQNRIALRLYPYLKGSAERLEKGERYKIAHDIKALFLYRVSGIIQGNTDNILISIFVGTVFVGYYSNYSMIVTQIAGIIGLVFNSVKASVGNLIASNESSNAQKLFFFNVLEMINFWIIGLCSVCFIVLFQDFITICFGEKYVLNMIVVIAIVLNFYTSNIRQSIWTFRETTGIFQETKYITAVTAVINLVLSLLFGYLWGMTGILMATVLARMLYAWWKEPVILYGKVFKMSSKSYMVTYIKRFFLGVGTCVISYGLSRCIIIDNSYIKFSIQVVICCIVPNLIFGIVFAKTKEFHYIKGRLVQPILKKILMKK